MKMKSYAEAKVRSDAPANAKGFRCRDRAHHRNLLLHMPIQVLLPVLFHSTASPLAFSKSSTTSLPNSGPNTLFYCAVSDAANPDPHIANGGQISRFHVILRRLFLLGSAKWHNLETFILAFDFLRGLHPSFTFRQSCSHCSFFHELGIFHG
jgi:hypothetical protein